MSRKRLLIAEDDPNIREGLVAALESEGYLVDAASDGRQAEALRGQRRYDLALLDIMMPGKDGYTLCHDFRRADPELAIILLTAKSQEVDKVLGLKLGADDYVTKPFGLSELLARVEAALRRCSVASEAKPPSAGLPDEIAFGNLVARRSAYELRGGDRRVPLTGRELALVEMFYRNQGAVLTRNALLDQVWGIEYYGTTRTLDQHIAQLRKKAQSLGDPNVIETVHGIGYRYR